MSLTSAQRKHLEWLASNGGEAIVQGNCVVSVTTLERTNQASAISFLHLLTMGVLYVSGGRICVSDYGRRLLP